jgi:CHAT domain-containing protein
MRVKVRYLLQILIIVTSIPVLSQVQLVEKNLDLEEPIAANFYLKSIPNTAERSLLMAECAVLEGDLKKMEELIYALDESELDDCKLLRYFTLLGILRHKQNDFEGSAKNFDIAGKISSKCKTDKTRIYHFLYWSGYNNLDQNKLASSEKELKEALSFFEGDSVNYYVKNGRILFWLGTIKYKQNDFDSALILLQRSLHLFENIPLDKSSILIKIYNNIGNTYFAKADYVNAIGFYKKSIEVNKLKLKDEGELAISSSNLGRFYDYYENHLEAEAWHKEALNWMSKSNLDPARRSRIIQNYGTSLTNVYELNLALDYYLQAFNAISPYQSLHGDIFGRIALNIINTFHNLEMTSNAEEWENKLTPFFESNEQTLPTQYNEWRLWKAVQLIQQKRYVESIAILDELGQTTKTGEDEEFKFAVFSKKAECLYFQRKYKDSRIVLNKLLVHQKTLYPVTHPNVIFLLNGIGSSFFDENIYMDSVLHYLNLAKKNNQISTEKNLPNELYASKVEWIVSNIYLLKTDIKKYEEEKLPFQNFTQSEGLIYSTLSVLESKRIEFRNERDATNLYRMTRDFFDEAMKYYFILFQHTGDKQYINKAFLISEKSKYQTLQNAMKLDRVSAFAGVTNKLMQEEQKLAGQVAQLEYQYSQELAKQEEPLPELVQEYVTQWHSNSNRLNHLVDSIKNNLPNYYNLKFNRATTEISEIQAGFLSKETDMAWVSYYVGYTDCYAIVITHDNKYFLKLDPSEKITRQLKSFNNYISHHINDELQQTSHALYAGLFQQVDSCLKIQTKKIKKVVIIPDGALNYLNFELLGKPTHKSWHYALYDYQFSYGYSSTLLFNEFSDQPKWKSGTLNMIGFAPEFLKNSDRQTSEPIRDGNEKPGYDFFDFSPLEKNQEEVEQVARILKQKKISTSLYLGSKADESSFKKADLNSFNIIHLATHGFVSDQQKNVAGIAFAKSENSQEDGILFMDEIFNLKNRANLVCLSACETGSGVYQQGEGLVGLTRAFIYSGAQNLVVSLWKVQDESTATLMTNFYSSFVKNQSVSESLHQAKIAMIKKNPTIHPSYWSAFIHVGLN